MLTITIDGIEVKAKQGTNILWVALDNGLYIPNLCAVREATTPFASCRLCFVEIEGRNTPVTACTEPVSDGMVVHLNTPKVKRLRNTAFELLLSHHHLDCAHCAKNRTCELQNIASRLGLKLKTKRLKRIPRNLPIDSSHTLFTYDPNKCIICGKCVWACQVQGSGILDFAFRGIDTVVSTFSGMPLAEAGCTSCLACVNVCPVGSLVAKPGVSPIFLPRAGI
ncbi:MAG: (2Fe-2S)-binding protein [Dehalococcoidia bacterium]|nr:(2Fe-2S)-binding protein [Dehalococcoidia bacterium]